MSKLIAEAFSFVDVLGPHVAEGHYDLVSSDGYIILPSLWHVMVQPGWTVTMHMWPLPEPKIEGPVVEVPPPPPPAKASKKKKEPTKVPKTAPPSFELSPPPAAKARKKKKPGASTLWYTQGKGKSKAEKTPFGGPIELESIADYVPKEQEVESNLYGEWPEGVLPSDADKADVARYYLMKWTTLWEAAREQDGESTRLSKDEQLAGPSSKVQ